MKKRISLLLSFLFIVLSLVGVSFFNPVQAADDQVTLRISWWGSQSRHDYTLKLLDMYTKLHPNVSFEPEYTGWADYWTKLSYQAAANDLPDIMQSGIGWPETTTLINANMFADLTPYRGKELDLSGVADSLVKTGMNNEKLLGIPVSSNALAIIYDPEILQKADIKAPAANYTWDDFVSICKTINDKLGIYGTGEIETPNILLTYYPRQFGEHFYDKDAKYGVGISKEVLVNYWKLKLKLQKAGLMPDLAEISQEMGVEDHPIVHGKAAFAWKWAPNLSVLEAPTGKSYKLLTLPGPNQDDALYIKARMHFSVAESSKHKAEAAKFISWLLNDIEANQIMNAERGVPADADVRAAMIPNLGETQKKVFEYLDFASQHSSPKDTFLPENVNDINQFVNELEEQVLFEVFTPEEAADKFFENLPNL